MYSKEQELQRWITMGEILIPILLHGTMTNYQAGLLINNYVLWTVLAFFQRTNFCKVERGIDLNLFRGILCQLITSSGNS